MRCECGIRMRPGLFAYDAVSRSTHLGPLAHSPRGRVDRRPHLRCRPRPRPRHAGRQVGEAVKAVVQLQTGHEPSDVLIRELQLLDEKRRVRSCRRSRSTTSTHCRSRQSATGQKSVRARCWSYIDRAVSYRRLDPPHATADGESKRRVRISPEAAPSRQRPRTRSSAERPCRSRAGCTRRSG